MRETAGIIFTAILFKGSVHYLISHVLLLSIPSENAVEY